MGLNVGGDAYRWCLICLLPTYLCLLSDRQDRQESFLRVDMLNSCCCNAEWNSWKAHLCTRSVSINISHVQKLLWGGRNSLWNGAIINHCLRGTSSYLCLSLWWLIPAEMGLAHLIKRSEPRTRIICNPAPQSGVWWGGFNDLKKKVFYSNQNWNHLYCD